MWDRILSFIKIWLSRSGDDTFWSWVITFTYALSIILSFYYTGKIRERGPLRSFWIFVSFFLLLMGINKQLDVQILVGMVGRFCTYHLGLMEYRHLIYIVFFLAIFLAMLTGGVILFIKTRSVIFRSKLPLAGILVLMFFVLIRAGYIYVRHVHGLELLGLLFILSGIILNIRRDSLHPGSE